jgi:hypothetical protein
MSEYDSQLQVEKKARKRTFVSAAVTSTAIILPLIILHLLTLKPKVPFITAYAGAVCFSIYISPLGALVGSIGSNRRQVPLGATMSAIVFCYAGFVFAAITINSININIPRLYIPLICSISAVMGALCGGIAAMFGRTCRESQGKRFWPQFSMAELMMFVFLIAILISCLVSLRQIIGNA